MASLQDYPQLKPRVVAERVHEHVLDAFIEAADLVAAMDRRHKAGILAESDGSPNGHQKSLLKRNLYNDLKTCKSLPRVDGCRLVRYNFASNSKFGRLFAGGASLQTFPRDIRAALTCGLLHDLDMVNCHMHIIAHCCRSHGIDCPLLTEYIACREAVLSRIAMANGLMRDDVKCVILKVTYGSRATYDSRPVHDTWLGMYAMECKRIAKQLCGCAESPHADLVTKSKTSNPLFSAVSKLACGVENCALGIALSILPTTTQAAALAFDGFMLCGDMPAGLQERMTDKIYEKIGARLPFVEKAIPHTTVDMLRAKFKVPVAVVTAMPGAMPDWMEEDFTPDFDVDAEEQANEANEAYETESVDGVEQDEPDRYLADGIILLCPAAMISIAAGMGDGKTCAIMAFVEHAVREGKTVVFATQRRIMILSTLGKELRQRGIPFTDYRDINGAINVADHQVLLIEYESLHRLLAGTYHCVIYDEFRSIINTMNSSTNGVFKIDNYERFADLVVTADKNVFTDRIRSAHPRP